MENKVLELAFPWITHDLKADFLSRPMQLKYKAFLGSQDLRWMTEDLTFLSTHAIRLVDCGEVKSVNAFSVGLHSAYFNLIFKYSQQNPVNLRLDWLSCLCPSISASLGFIAASECRANPTDDDCLQLFMAADFILCAQLRDQCLRYINRRCAEDRLAALAIWTFARRLNMPDLVGASLKYVLRGFPELRSASEFLELEADALLELLGHRMLNCTSELQVLQVIGQWLLRHQGPDSHNRGHVERLLCCLRLGQMHSEEVAAALLDPLLAGNAEFAQFVRSYPLRTEFSRRHAAELAHSRSPRWPQRVLLVFGGWFQRQGPSAFCQVYDPRADTWDVRLPQQRIGWLEDRSHACCALIGDVVHVVGGYNGAEALKSVMCFDRRRPHLGWYEGSCMLQPRYYHCCAELGGFLYAISGQSMERRLTHVERVRAADNSWLPIDQLRRPRCEAAAVAFRDKLLVVGGFDGRVHLDTAEVYCPDAGSWTLITGHLNQPRAGLGLVVFNGTVYALCGRNSSGWRRCVEGSEDLRVWRVRCEMSKSRSNFGCNILDDRVYLLGGICGPGERDIMASVEWVEPKLKRVGQACPMPFPASGVTTCSLDLLAFADCTFVKQLRRMDQQDSGGGCGQFYPAPLRMLDDSDSDDSSDEAMASLCTDGAAEATGSPPPRNRCAL